MEVPEGSKKHIRSSKFILRRISCERKDASAALGGPKKAQKPPKGAPEVSGWISKKSSERQNVNTSKSTIVLHENNVFARSGGTKN